MSIGSFAEAETCRTAALSGQTVVFDGYIQMYKFLTAIRRDGDYVRSRDGHVISHLIGWTNKLGTHIQNGVQPIVVFDGPPPQFKRSTLEERQSQTKEASANFMQAKANGDTEAMQKWGPRAAKVESAFLESTYEVFDALGVPYMQAPSEADPQCAHIVAQGVAEHICTTDYDVFCYGDESATMLRKFSGEECEVISFKQILNAMDLTLEQYRWVRICAGTDYNQSPKRVAWKRAMNIVEGCKTFEEVIDAAQSWGSGESRIDPDRWRTVNEWFQNPEVADYTLEEPELPGYYRSKEILTEKYGLRESQMKSVLEAVYDE